MKVTLEATKIQSFRKKNTVPTAECVGSDGRGWAPSECQGGAEKWLQPKLETPCFLGPRWPC